jgi:hypothetical protein
MTLLLTEIHWLDGFSKSCILFAADRRISRNGIYDGIRKKIFQIPYLPAGIGYFGLAELHTRKAMSDWLLGFIRRNSHLKNMQIFANELANHLNSDIIPQFRSNYISGFHLAGYNSAGIPEFWYIRNVEDDRRTITGIYECREDFLNGNARAFGYDGLNPNSIRWGGQSYRNGDIRAHHTAWERIDEAFKNLLNEPEFKRLKTIADYEKWVKFKMDVIAYFYKKYCNISLIAKPIDTFSITSTI